MEFRPPKLLYTDDKTDTSACVCSDKKGNISWEENTISMLNDWKSTPHISKNYFRICMHTVVATIMKI